MHSKNRESLSVEIPTSRTRLNLQLPELQTSGRLLNGMQTFSWIYDRKNLVGWTYSYNPAFILVTRFKQLIACVGLPRSNVRLAGNTHIKCYIDKKEQKMVIGSFNLTEPTINDLCIEITDRALVNHMRLQFSKHWKLLQ